MLRCPVRSLVSARVCMCSSPGHSTVAATKSSTVVPLASPVWELLGDQVLVLR